MDTKPNVKRSVSDLSDIDESFDPPRSKKKRINGVENSTNKEKQDNNLDDSGVHSGEGDTPTKSNNGHIQFGEKSTVDSVESESDMRTPLIKIASVQRDAEIIASVVGKADVSQVYEKLASQRKNPNRMDIVTTQLLDSSDIVTETARSIDKPEDVKNTIYQDVKAVVNRVKRVSPDLRLNPAEVYVLLERHSDAPERTDIVANLFIDSVKKDESHSEGDLFEDVTRVVAMCPESNPDLVYAMLEELKDNKERIQKVVDKLTKQENKTVLKKDDSLPADSDLRNDPVFMDMRKIAKMFPEMDRNEIYAHLEAHHGKNDRVQVVIDEILRSTKGSLGSHDSLSTDGVSISQPRLKGACGLQGEVDELREIFPDCDPNYLFEELENRANDAGRVKNLAARMFETRNYPKLKDVVEKQQKMMKKVEIRNMKFDLKNFLSKFPNPEEYFYKTDAPMSENYKNHSIAYMKNVCPLFKDGYLKKILDKNNNHLASAIQEVKEFEFEMNVRGERQFESKKLRPERRIKIAQYPDEPDERFFHEVLFLQNEQKIKDYFHTLDQERKHKIATAKKKGELYECGCCYDDEVLFEELSACSDGHLFCRECIRRSTESALGEGKTKFPCLTGECEFDIPLTVLQEVLSAAMFSRMLSRLQEEEIRMADIPDLVSCPFCSFATVMSNPDDKVFKCLNQECLKETCRLCKEPNHVPLKCEEVEKQGETSMRTYIENRISEAMLRTCTHCNKRFFKDSGCNKMTCTCGATMCYVCREPDIDYDHFNDGRCSNTEDATQIHLKEMEEAAAAAKAQYLRDHPDADDATLKYDPKKHVEEFRNMNGHYKDDDDYDDDDGDGDDYPDLEESEIDMDSDESDPEFVRRYKYY